MKFIEFIELKLKSMELSMSSWTDAAALRAEYGWEVSIKAE